MQKLRFAGVSDDGQHLVLETWDGEQQFHTVIDQTLRNAVVKARKAPPARPLNGDGTFGPRDIQTRFRQGATVDEIVAESGWKPERVRRYEWPIVAERQHVVAAARQAEVEPLDGSEAKPLNHQVVAVREAWNFADGDAQWNSWQREDGLWNVSVSVDYSRQALDRIPEGSDFPARFVFNPHNQSLRAGNAVAEFLLGRLPENAPEEPVAVPVVPSPDADPEPEAVAPADSAAPESVDEGTESAPRAVAGTDAPRETAGQEATAAHETAQTEDPAPEATRLRAVPTPETTDQDRLLDELDARRRTRAGQDPASDARVRDLTERLAAETDAEDAAEADPATPAADATEDSSDTARAGTADDSAEGRDDAGRSTDAQASTEQSPESESGRSRGRTKRPSVPSWDDIVFGGKH